MFKRACFFVGIYLLLSLGLAFAQEPADVEPLLAKGEMAYNLGNYSEAMEWYTRTLQIDGKNLRALNGAGLSALELGAEDRAASFFKSALEVDSEDNVALLGLSRALILKKDFDNAESYIERIRSQGKDVPGAFRLAVIYYEAVIHRAKGEIDDARAKFQIVANQKLDRTLAQEATRRLKSLPAGGEKAEQAQPQFEQQAGAQPQQDKKSALSGRYGLGIQYDSNVILEPRDYEVADEDDTREVTLLGLRYKIIREKTADLYADAMFYQSFHNGTRVTKSLNITAGVFGLGFAGAQPLGAGHIIYGATANYSRILLGLGLGKDFNDYSQVVSADPYVGYAFSKDHSIKLKYSYRNTDFYENPPSAIELPPDTPEATIMGDDNVYS